MEPKRSAPGLSGAAGSGRVVAWLSKVQPTPVSSVCATHV